MLNQLLDFAASDELAGFRLKRLEVYNWGTFHNRVWAIEPQGKNCLLTGDIGSGKSTLVDAITTLLVPAQRISYNKAAGADSRERSLRSYVLGYYKSERSASGQSSKPVALRDHNDYSVILGVFANSGYGQEVSLAQVFWSKDLQGQPDRFYLVANQALTITEDFANFGPDLNQLRKRLRDSPEIELFKNFPPYAAAFRRRFGINNDQALELFHQTVSLKSVGNLTEFVRTHMLESGEIGPRIEALIDHFDNLNRAHEAVLKAKRQVNLLTPLAADCQKHRESSAQAEQWRYCRDGLRVYFAAHKAALLDQRLEKLAGDKNRLTQSITRLDEIRHAQLGDRDQLKQNIVANGGDRLERLTIEIRTTNQEKAKRENQAARYQALAQQVGLPERLDNATFFANLNRLKDRHGELDQQEADLQNTATEQAVALADLRQKHQELTSEIDSLKKRRSNIDSRQIKIRTEICAALKLDESAMPFVGELIKVNDEESAWEGAVERLLHNFGLSLLVPDQHYQAVAGWVDQTRLQGRLVYFRVRAEQSATPPPIHPQSLTGKITIKPDAEFYGWLEAELARRFDFACCDSLEEFRREQQAITLAGQIKTGGQRHEKDDRYHLQDRSRYILGWTNAPKIAALTAEAEKLASAIQTIAERISGLQQQLRKLSEQKTILVQLGEFHDYTDLDWQELSRKGAELAKELQDLENASNILLTLREQLKTLEDDISQNENKLDGVKRDRAKNEEKQEQAEKQLALCRQTSATIPAPEQLALTALLTPLQAEALTNQQLSVESCDHREREMRDWLQKKIDNEDRHLKHLTERIIKAMQGFCHEFPLETQDFDANIEADGEYLKLLDQLQADDLPRFEKRFKELLNENTIREIANFQSHLTKERQNIKERIDLINQSLTDIEYNPGRYILLEAQISPDPEIREFQQKLRACTEGTLTGSDDEQYAENKFLQVKEIIDRFRGREGTTDLDKRWMIKVTDVRRWFEFAASERWLEDRSEYEHYTDSSGKSGGQKEKLAYTVLAASLAYQFGLEWGAVRSRSFRFVVIDEAFGRGSDESARYGLELFAKLGLQLLIVTPLQKIHIIEPYVASVGFVHNEEGRESLLRNLTIAEYRAEREARS
ncbi:MAG: ATP-dependent exonuclease SbcCD, C subunit-like protein [Proteobacteria bacterium]|nr:ATP-dependent exonuclease SbcCD, C subunit-like protein [Pseudomonadota bacterium]MBU1685946.1 ATP-dependent exonuclease SbcCD, C subunit-like protein [Pseudomonadota bacterium]